MDQSINLHNEKSQSPSRLVVLLALIIAITLPFLLVKIFSSKKPEKSFNNTSRQNIITPPPDVKEKPPVITEAPKLQPLKEPVHAKTIKPAPVKNEWITIRTRERDTLAAVFSRTGLGISTLQKILKGNPHANLLTKLKPNQEIQYQLKANGLEKMVTSINNLHYFVITREGNGYKTSLNARKMDSQNRLISGSVTGSLYLTSKKYNIPYKIIRQMTDIFAWDINFSKDIKAGDKFSIIFKDYLVDGKLVGVGDILAVSYQNKGRIFNAIQHIAKNGQMDYYSPEGISLKKAFDRYPLRFSHISSTFSLARYHPILHYTRAHKGIDLAAPIGTPIRATGSGKIEMIGRNHGYGNMIKIKHDHQFSTIYGHMLKFQKGLFTGSLVRRGDVIGYVGQSGLASGPHCHFEFHSNNQPKNPATVNLPRGLSIPSRELASFKARVSQMLAQMNAPEKPSLVRLAAN